MYINGSFHLSYCTNVHNSESWETTFSTLNNFIPKIKKDLSDRNPFGISLRLSHKTCKELSQRKNLAIFKDWLQIHQLYVLSIDGVAYGKMQGHEVKDLLYAPDWASTARLDYTLMLINQMSYLLPKRMQGSITTSPLGFRHWYSDEDEKEQCYIKSAINLVKVVEVLYELECAAEKYIHLDLKPEPNSLLSNSTQVIDFFRAFLLPTGVEMLSKKLGKKAHEIEAMIFRYVNICYNTGAFFMAFESPSFTFKRFKQTDIKIGKIQMSSVLRFQMNEHKRERIIKAFNQFNQNYFLHPVTEKIGETVITYLNLEDIVNKHLEIGELHALFNIPIYTEAYKNLESSQYTILETLKCLKKSNVCELVEIESYMWDLLPEKLKKNGLQFSIAKELRWLKERMQEEVYAN
ncbi:metabolite traffic protein EboE [Galbibacter mesophilus]|uniref:metabolite traffic protein EboE n=1 Tax=Galbibacter mesophilus TaxID=379069 RepID=UPI00191F9EF9|nr:metabolite traffic protein EboE [Galbibacter mesophilus]MCM5663014.1 metabolite traffic protein EboE [Galbibacter mesophilus]